MANLWHLIGRVSITDIGDKRILFRFYYEVDRDKVVKGSPWTFNNHLLIISMLNEEEDPLEVPLNNANFYRSTIFLQGCEKVDVRKPLKRWKRLLIAKLKEWSKDLLTGWDTSLRALPRRAAVRESPWLREPGSDWGVISGPSGSKQGNDFRNQQIPNLMRNYRANLGLNLMVSLRRDSTEKQREWTNNCPNDKSAKPAERINRILDIRDNGILGKGGNLNQPIFEKDWIEELQISNDYSEGDKYVVKDRGFRFERMWLLEELCEDEVKSL
ncbi:hypothetical protein GOBAR_AA30908 [Gossypium barbadense]|uniref:DUF4283 domain-containing protein n=1 Tax=Gossypium barbadense TaxID=3634 RepID=A0A2P5WFA4_GOSBA|nr:hypothetical protein GOBAR_AA30908 [Gossypium barbadense]